MPDVQYPFIDIAVHARIRERFARGEAMVLFSPDLGSTIWANGRGAALFGATDIYDFMESGPSPQHATVRQLAAAKRGISRTGDTATFTIRYRDGFSSAPATATAEMIETADGTGALLFSVQPAGNTLTANDCASRMIEGFHDPDVHVAVLDDDGHILASSAGFAPLEIAGQTAGSLVRTAAASPDRLVKRPVPTTKGYLPAAIGALSSSPALNLLFVADATVSAADEPEPTNDEPAPAAEPVAQEADRTDTSYEQVIDAVAGIVETGDDDDALPVAETEAGHASVVPGGEAAVDSRQTFVFDPAARATRFVWKVDAGGRFSEISREFAEAVGPNVASIDGMTFREVADLFGLDPDNRVAELLGKRDTWSGKTLYWPAQGTGLRVPIDLAALPTYTRARQFDGFRGFGIIRSSDAVEDPFRKGMEFVNAFAEADDSDIVATPEETATEDAGPEDTVDAVAVNDDATLVAHQAEADISHGQAEEQAETAVNANAPAAIQTEADVAVPEEHVLPPGEVPALRIMPNPARRYADNVIRVEELRARSRLGDGLTPGEKAAFYEIGRTLGSSSGTEEQDGPSEPEATIQPSVVEESAPLADIIVPAEATEQQDTAGPAPSAVEVETETVATVEAEQDNSTTADIATGRSRELDATILDEMPVALLVHTGDRLLHANPEFLRLTGYSSTGELEETGGLDALLQHQELDDMPDGTGGMVAVRADDTLVPVTARLKSIRWEGSSALMLALIPSGLPAAAPAPVTDEAAVSAQAMQQAERDSQAELIEKLHIEAEELRSILETATDGVVLLDEDCNIRSMNGSASALFNYDNHETAGKPFVILFAHESQKSILDYLARLAGSGFDSVLNDGREVIGREASGGFIPLFMTIGRLKSSQGYCAVIRDVTHWKRTEDELHNARRNAEIANAHKSDFLARVSHEIRTPLNAIIGFADMIATERFGPSGHPRYVEYAGDIGRSGRHVLDIVNDLLDISKIEAGQMELEFTPTCLNETVSETVSLVQPQANNQRVIIRTALSPSVPRVFADIRSIRQIVLNVLSNSIRFTPSGGQIVVSTSYEANGNVVLRFRDTGIGMTRTELEQAMKPFRQVTTGTRLRGDGTGLGLPLTKAMVDANCATFAINSAPNEGTLVEIVFPASRVLAD